MACPYCHTQLTIPLELRRNAEPVYESPRVMPQQLSSQETQQQVADFLRQAQPVATRAWNFYALSSWLARLAPDDIGVTQLVESLRRQVEKTSPK